MAVENLYGSEVMTGLANTTPATVTNVAQAGGRVRYWTDTVEVTAAASATSDYLLARLPASAILLPGSKIHYDDLASTGSPTVDVGLFNVGSNITDDIDAIAAGIDVTAAGSTSLVSDVTTFAKKLWEYVNGQTTDPQGQLDIKASILDAATNTGGTITIELYYTID